MQGVAAASAPPRARVQSVARAVQMVDIIARSPSGLTAKEISETTGVSRPATYHLLHTLTQTGVLARDERRYIVGMRTSVFAAGLARHATPLERVATAARALAQSTHETAIVAAWGSPGISVIGRAGNSATGRELTRGFSGHAHARASGKLLLAYASSRSRSAYLAEHPLEPRTPRTIVDPALLERELELIRSRGYAVDDEEFAPDVCCAAAPVETGRGMAALCVVAPAGRFHRERRRYCDELLRIAQSSGVPPLVAA